MVCANNTDKFMNLYYLLRSKLLKSIFVFGLNQEIACYYSFMLEGNFECGVNTYDELGETTFDDLKNVDNLSLIVISSELTGADVFIKSMLMSKIKVPMVITHTKDHARAAKIKYKYNALYELYEDGSEPGKFIEISLKALQRKNKIDNSKPNYCRIKSSYFEHSSKTVCDIFLKLSDDKYIKIFNRFHEFSDGDLKRFYDRNTKYFFIHERDYKSFVNLMSKALTNSEGGNSPTTALAKKENKILTSMNCQEMVQETIDKLGLNESAISIANVAITSTLKLLEKGNVESMFNDVFNNGEFTGEHSLIVTYLASAICKETQWNTRENILRLCIAGFFHDITLTKEELAKVSKKDSYEFNELSRRDQAIVLAHAKKAVEIVNKIDGIPIGVDTIIDFHHERYDGSGFPREVDYKRFSPLAAIFVVAHEITDYLFDSGFIHENIEDIVDEMETTYNRGCFKNIVPVLRKVLGLQNEIEMAG